MPPPSQLYTFSACGLLTASLLLSACAPVAPTPTAADQLAADGQALFGRAGQPARQPGDPSSSGASPAPVQGWSVVLAAFRGPDAPANAAQGLEKVRRAAGLSEAFAEPRGVNWIVGIGRFPSPGDPAAKALLERMRTLEVAGERPFSTAVLLAPDFSLPTTSGGKPEWNLTNARELNGKQAKYTLQIGTYGGIQPGSASPAELAEARAAAETAVTKLRAEGETAFYFHSARMSTVTVGLFDDAVLDNPLDAELVALRVKYPNRLHNGKGLMTRINQEKTPKLEDSKLVAVP